MKHELLAPVGSMEALYQAIHHGADAVYLGGKRFGARAFANNFDDHEMIDAINLCHLYGVRIYVTVNTLIYDLEVSSFLSYITFLIEHGVDALIMQDIGMIRLVRKHFPSVEIHASTQMHNGSLNALKELEKLGVVRAVIDREVPLDVINQWDTSLDLEIFIHGALCVSYSGCCLFSSMVGNRSGNRGECAGNCRLPYQLVDNNDKVLDQGYLLSMKELNTAEKWEELLKSRAYSFKIEGRMKSPEYVGFITAFYRMMIDEYEQTGKVNIQEEKVNQLKTLFNREFTKGFLFNEDNGNIVNSKTSNHIGLPIGKVINVSKKYITIRLNRSLVQEDAIRFVQSNKGMVVNKLYDQKERLIHEANKNSIVLVDNKVDLTTMDEVNKTQDRTLLSELKKYQEKKIPITMEFSAKLDKELVLIIQDGTNQVEVMGNKVSKALNQPITKEVVIKQLSKLGNTPFTTTIESIKVELEDNIFINIKEINELRRLAVEELMKKRTSMIKHKEVHDDLIKIKEKPTNVPKISVSVRTTEQLKVCLKYPDLLIFTSNISDYQQYKNQGNVHLETSLVNENSTKYDDDILLINELGDFTQKGIKIVNYPLNTTNAYAALTYLEKGASEIIPSFELKVANLPDFIKQYQQISHKMPPLRYIIYGRCTLMTMKYCPIKHAYQTCQKFCQEKILYLKNEKQEKYPMIKQKCLTKILHRFPRNDLAKIEELKSLGISSFHLIFTIESVEEINQILKEVNSKIHSIKSCSFMLK